MPCSKFNLILKLAADFPQSFSSSRPLLLSPKGFFRLNIFFKFTPQKLQETSANFETGSCPEEKACYCNVYGRC